MYSTAQLPTKEMKLALLFLQKGAKTVLKVLKFVSTKLLAATLKAWAYLRKEYLTKENFTKIVESAVALVKRIMSDERVQNFVYGLIAGVRTHSKPENLRASFNGAVSALHSGRAAAALEASLKSGLERLSTSIASFRGALSQPQPTPVPPRPAPLRASLTSAHTLPIPALSGTPPVTRPAADEDTPARPLGSEEEVGQESPSFGSGLSPTAATPAVPRAPLSVSSRSRSLSFRASPAEGERTALPHPAAAADKAGDSVLGLSAEVDGLLSRVVEQSLIESESEENELDGAGTPALLLTPGARSMVGGTDEDDAMVNFDAETPRLAMDNAGKQGMKAAYLMTPIATDVRYGLEGNRLQTRLEEMPSVGCWKGAAPPPSSVSPLPAPEHGGSGGSAHPSLSHSFLHQPLSLSLLSARTYDDDVSSVVFSETSHGGSEHESDHVDGAPTPFFTPLKNLNLTLDEPAAAPPPVAAALLLTIPDSPAPAAPPPTPAFEELPPAAPMGTPLAAALGILVPRADVDTQTAASDADVAAPVMIPEDVALLAASLRSSLGKKSEQLRSSTVMKALMEEAAARQSASFQRSQGPRGSGAGSIVATLSKGRLAASTRASLAAADPADAALENAPTLPLTPHETARAKAEALRASHTGNLPLRPMVSVEGLRGSMVKVPTVRGQTTGHLPNLDESENADLLSPRDAGSAVKQSDRTGTWPGPAHASGRHVSPLGKVLQQRAARELQRQIVEAFAHVPHQDAHVAGPGSPGARAPASPLAHVASPFQGQAPPSTCGSAAGPGLLALAPASPVRQPNFNVAADPGVRRSLTDAAPRSGTNGTRT